MVNIVTRATIRHGIAQEFKDIMQRVKDVAERRDRYKVDAIAPAKTLVDPRITAMYTEVTDLVGVEEAKLDVITRLGEGDDMPADQQKRIVSIAGFGRLGKTTLAKAVYDEIKGKFDCKAFISVSRNPDTKKLLMDMLYELDKEKFRNIHSSMLDEKHLIDQIREQLQNKRYLIVIDDIWDIKPWRIIECALVKNNLRSRIITTTRIIGVAEQIGGCYKLKPLSGESSGILFHRRVFGSKDECPKQFLEVSERILKKCGGVPLAIITTSGLLANRSRNIQEWYDVCDSIGSGLGSNNPGMDDMWKILQLSYYDLPSHLKTCLLYLSMFPEDYVIKKDRLIWMWIAEDFVKHGQGDKVGSLFEHGESYFNELLNRSLLQPANVDEDGTPHACRVHDTILDLICSLSRDECFVTTVSGDGKQNTPYLVSKVRRLSLHGSTAWPSMNMSKLRSLTIFSVPEINWVPSLSCYHLLRVLDLRSCYLLNRTSLLRSVGTLFHLRYLDLSCVYTSDELLLAEIGKLKFLQVLKFQSYYVELPPSFAGLRHLMCLEVKGDSLPPNGFGNLTSLEVLMVTIVNSASMVEGLSHLTQLRKLRVKIDVEMDDKGGWDESLRKCLVESLAKLNKIQLLNISDPGFARIVPSMFPRGAMPKLEVLCIGIRMDYFCCGGELVVDDLALDLLPSLRKMVVEFLEQHKVSKEVTIEVKEKLRKEADVHPQHPRIIFSDEFSYDELNLLMI